MNLYRYEIGHRRPSDRRDVVVHPGVASAALRREYRRARQQMHLGTFEARKYAVGYAATLGHGSVVVGEALR